MLNCSCTCERQGFLSFFGNEHFCATVYCLLRCLPFVRRPCHGVLVPCDSATCGLCPVPSANPHTCPQPFIPFDNAFSLVLNSHLFRDILLAHCFIPCGKYLLGYFLGCAGEVEWAIPEAGHVWRRWRDICVDSVRREVVCGISQRPRGSGEWAGVSSSETLLERECRARIPGQMEGPSRNRWSRNK